MAAGIAREISRQPGRNIGHAQGMLTLKTKSRAEALAP